MKALRGRCVDLTGREKGGPLSSVGGRNQPRGTHMKTTLLAGALATSALWSLAPSAALANVLSSGDTGVAPDTFAAPPTFTILTSVSQEAFSNVEPDLVVNLFEAVISDPTNVFGVGDLDFIIVVS